jgi:hypothetical protein
LKKSTFHQSAEKEGAGRGPVCYWQPVFFNEEGLSTNWAAAANFGILYSKVLSKDPSPPQKYFATGGEIK